jgi:uncharacterized membrane protein YkvA (DUF1232 family)
MRLRIGRWIGAARLLRARVYLVALWKLVRHPQTPRAAKWIAYAVIAYAVSPIDLIPDFVPVLGLLDDLLLIPLGVALVVRLTPAPLWRQLLHEAEVAQAPNLPKLWWGAAAIVVVWLALLGAVLAWAAGWL